MKTHGDPKASTRRVNLTTPCNAALHSFYLGSRISLVASRNLCLHIPPAGKLLPLLLFVCKTHTLSRYDRVVTLDCAQTFMAQSYIVVERDNCIILFRAKPGCLQKFKKKFPDLENMELSGNLFSYFQQVFLAHVLNFQTWIFRLPGFHLFYLENTEL